jgi:hypothetical protein
VAELGRDDVDGNARQEQGGRVNVAEIVEAGSRQWGVRVLSVVALDPERFTPVFQLE